MNRKDVLQYTGKVDHITADHFLIIGYDVGEPDDPLYIEAKFRVNKAGVAYQMGLKLEEAMGKEKIWFDRTPRV